ncbi:DNA-binding domain-containing protein [Pseudomonas savastanoi pv. phaseolicola]|uniref:DNA-binding domain-containing protein n=1 Tax=Pseudomonas TaxID=286 RepID=UPI0006814205|nr:MULTISPECIES: DNA-binding domain-containing protein [Pseudomonas]MDG6380740.1 DNA-binding domain-containing protein [Pseudomonas savastanoi pv. phaseolicola]MDG6390742.1 DNA-binding domain-containing protein [Pseudomonas savastanoi pv. phaseolicola]
MDYTTLYRWIERYRDWNEVLALVPRKRGWSSGNSRISYEAEQLVREVIDQHYLTIQRPSIQSTIREIERRARTKGITPPGASAIRARIKRIPEKHVLRQRG